MNTVGLSDVEVLHRESIIIDGHCHALGPVMRGQKRLGERAVEKRLRDSDPLPEIPPGLKPRGSIRGVEGAVHRRLEDRPPWEKFVGHFDFPRAKEGGLTAQFMSTGGDMRHALQVIDAFYGEIEAYPDQAMPAVCADDILRAKELGKIALVLKTQGVEGLEGDLRILRVWCRLGLRVLGLTGNGRNEAADGVGERRTGGGLTCFGVDLIKECNRLGIIVDVAHVAPAGVRDVLELSDSPVIVTHANCDALWSHPRNLTDAQLEAIARQDGVVGVTADPHFLGEAEIYTHLSVLLDHIDHMVSVMGEDGVGIGLDFNGVEEHMEGIEDVSKLLNLTKGLAERGYSAEAIGKILGGNFLRVMREVL